jgi:phosphoribosylaminoimidazole-succinocarboxamide synthase
MQTNTLNVKEGKAKLLRWDGVSETCEVEFKDCLTAQNGKQKEEIVGKGAVNAIISAKLFDFLNRQKIKTHFVQEQASNILQVKTLDMVPLEVIVRNYASGSFCKRFDVSEGKKLKQPVVQFHLKNDALNDPLMTEAEIFAFDLASPETLRDITNQALTINWLLSDFFKQVEVCLADFKLEFGFDKEGNLTLGDELSPDNMRLWTNYQEGAAIDRLDKDRFRMGLGGVLESYRTVLNKVNQGISKPIQGGKTPVKVKLQITPQPGLLDPTGRTLTDAANRLGFNEVSSIRAGKLLELTFNDFRVNLIEDLCERILVSPASESYQYEIIPIKANS